MPAGVLSRARRGKRRSWPSPCLPCVPSITALESSLQARKSETRVRLAATILVCLALGCKSPTAEKEQPIPTKTAQTPLKKATKTQARSRPEAKPKDGTDKTAPQSKTEAATQSTGASVTMARYSFDWFDPQRTKCSPLAEADWAALQKRGCSEARLGNPEEKRPVYKCRVSKKSELLVFTGKAHCIEELETMRANAP